MQTKECRIVHTSLPKVDGISLVTGSAKYADDFTMPGMLYAKVLTSPHPHANILRINTEKARALPGVHTVLTYHDISPIRHTRAGQSYPEPSPYDRVILDKKVRFVGDRVAVVAAESLNIAEAALSLIEVEYEVLPAIFNMEDAMKPGAPVIHDEPDAAGIYDASRNIAAYLKVEIGDVTQGFQDADLIVENTYRTQRVKHCALETHGSVGYLDEYGRLVLITSTQVPFHTRRQLAHVLELPINRIRVIKPHIGGGFGNKQAMCLEDLVGLLVLRTRQPVKLIFSREEEFVGGFCRHPQIIKLKTGVKNNGAIIAQEMQVLGNTGAYGEHAPTVQECTGRKVLPLYPAPHVRFEAYAVYTNLPVSGAFRGYGAPQGFFALESQMDEIAHRLKMDPLELRQKNRIREGDTDRLAKAFGDKEDRSILSCGLGECIERGAAAIGWPGVQEIGVQDLSCQSQSQDKSCTPGAVKRGIGMACAMQGSGIAGVDWGSATITLNEDGTFTLYVGATDLGTGADTVLSQIAAETLGVTLDDIHIIAADTDITPFDVGAYASSTTYVSGGAVKKAAEQLLAEMRKAGVQDLSCCSSLQDKSCTPVSATASNIANTSPPPFVAQFAEVEIDTETGQIRVLKLVTAVDCGVAINPKLAEGQVEGAITQGLGFALCEEMIFDEQGRLLNPNFADYKLFNAFDMPELQTILVETHEPTGPYGAKSIAEVPINCPAPAIANAVYNAIGVRIKELPFTAENVLAGLKGCKFSTSH